MKYIFIEKKGTDFPHKPIILKDKIDDLERTTKSYWFWGKRNYVNVRKIVISSNNAGADRYSQRSDKQALSKTLTLHMNKVTHWV